MRTGACGTFQLSCARDTVETTSSRSTTKLNEMGVLFTGRISCTCNETARERGETNSSENIGTSIICTTTRLADACAKGARRATAGWQHRRDGTFCVDHPSNAVCPGGQDVNES